MSNRTLIELNHDLCPLLDDALLLTWAQQMRDYMRSGDRAELPYGVAFKHTRHHSDPDPSEIITADWQPMSALTIAANTTTYINVRSVTTYRWKPYKPDGARQMRAQGRWQRAKDPDGWENCSAPCGEWKLNR